MLQVYDIYSLFKNSRYIISKDALVGYMMYTFVVNCLYLKLILYADVQGRLTDVETHGYTGHKQAKEVLRDVGQGLK